MGKPFATELEALPNTYNWAMTQPIEGLDRLTHRCHILEFNGESYRLQDARRRRQSQSKQ